MHLRDVCSIAILETDQRRASSTPRGGNRASERETADESADGLQNEVCF